jgi:sugar/nucleoside kinase (ribokinase family)
MAERPDPALPADDRTAAQRLAAAAPSLRGRSTVVGFDAFVDAIVRPVRRKDAAGAPVLFRTIPEFAAHLAAAAGRSADTEILHEEDRLGGNAPLLARALAGLGVPTALAAPLGRDGIEPAFRGLADVGGLSLVNLGAPARSTNFEFDDGKLMFGDAAPLRTLSWEAAEAAEPPGAFVRRLRTADLVALVDWSYLLRMDALLDGVVAALDAPGPDGPPGTNGRPARTHLLFDLADPTTRPPEELRDFLLRMGRAGTATRRTVLGLNEKEAAAAAAALLGRTALSADGPEADARTVREKTGIGEVVVHGIDYAIGCDEDGLARVAGRRVDRPRISTGGGDNFNAGYCLGLLAGLPMPQRLGVAAAASGYYVETGHGAGFGEIVAEAAARGIR